MSQSELNAQSAVVEQRPMSTYRRHKPKQSKVWIVGVILGLFVIAVLVWFFVIKEDDAASGADDTPEKAAVKAADEAADEADKAADEADKADKAAKVAKVAAVYKADKADKAAKVAKVAKVAVAAKAVASNPAPIQVLRYKDKEISTDGRCGSSNNKRCPFGQCCSSSGYCGGQWPNQSDYCNSRTQGNNVYYNGDITSKNMQCGSWKKADGSKIVRICPDFYKCSNSGWCGKGPDYENGKKRYDGDTIPRLTTINDRPRYNDKKGFWLNRVPRQ